MCASRSRSAGHLPHCVLGRGAQRSWRRTVPGLLAQLAEQRTFNPRVQGSIPWRPTGDRNRQSSPRPWLHACGAQDVPPRAAGRRLRPPGRVARRAAAALQAVLAGVVRQHKDVHNAAVRERAERRVTEHRRRLTACLRASVRRLRRDRPAGARRRSPCATSAAPTATDGVRRRSSATGAQTAHTADLAEAELTAIRTLLEEVFDDLADADDEHALGGVHALVRDGDELRVRALGERSPLHVPPVTARLRAGPDLACDWRSGDVG
jgi:hypothetical protein